MPIGSTTRARLRNRHIGVLVESDYVEPELSYYQNRFAEEGADVHLITRLWGKQTITFTGHEYHAPLEVHEDIEDYRGTGLGQLDALIVPGGFVADRLRYAETPRSIPPAVDLLRQAFARTDLVKGFACHGLMLMAACPQSMRGRRVTCHNNLVGDVRNMGAVFEDEDLICDHDLLTVRTASHGPLLARAVIDALDRPTPSDNTRNDRSAATPKATRGNLANAIREGGRPRWLTTLGGRP